MGQLGSQADYRGESRSRCTVGFTTSPWGQLCARSAMGAGTWSPANASVSRALPPFPGGKVTLKSSWPLLASSVWQRGLAWQGPPQLRRAIAQSYWQPCAPFVSGYQNKMENLLVLYHNKNCNSYLFCLCFDTVPGFSLSQQCMCFFSLSLWERIRFVSFQSVLKLIVAAGACFILDHTGTGKHEVSFLSVSRGMNNCFWSLEENECTDFHHLQNAGREMVRYRQSLLCRKFSCNIIWA